MWFYNVNGQTLGPISEVELSARVQNGSLPPDVNVWREGMADWVRFSQARPAAPAIPPAFAVPIGVPASANDLPLNEPATAPAQGAVFETINSWTTVVLLVLAMFIFLGILASRPMAATRGNAWAVDTEQVDLDEEVDSSPVADSK